MKIRIAMRAFRALLAVLVAACLVPVAVFGLAYAAAALAGCAVDFEADTVCFVGGADVGWLIDRLVGFGVYGALTWGVAVYLFAGWVLFELCLIVFNRPRP